MFQVNWFRKGSDGSFLWPGFGENIRVLEWIQARVDGQVGATETPLGHIPTKSGLDTEGLAVDLDQLFAIDREAWLAEADDTQSFFDGFGDKVPDELCRAARDPQGEAPLRRLSPDCIHGGLVSAQMSPGDATVYT